MGSRTDLPTMRAAADVLNGFGVPNELRIISAHRTPQAMFDYATQAEERGIEVIIAGAGGAAHLPGMLASLCVLPVIGVPVPIGALNGADALLSIVQMPTGCPVATVAIGQASNAGHLALRILGQSDAELRSRVRQAKHDRRDHVLSHDEALRNALTSDP